MKMHLPLFLGAALALGCAAPAVAHPRPLNPQDAQTQATQDMDRERNSQAYKDGYAQGQTDAQRGSRNDQPTDRWTQDADRQAYRAGYDAGYRESSNVTSPAARMGHGDQQARQFGYEDGLAQGRKDRDNGKSFRPTNGDQYKHADHGWSSSIADKDTYHQMYREGYTKGYEEGYRGTGPH